MVATRKEDFDDVLNPMLHAIKLFFNRRDIEREAIIRENDPLLVKVADLNFKLGGKIEDLQGLSQPSLKILMEIKLDVTELIGACNKALSDKKTQTLAMTGRPEERKYISDVIDLGKELSSTYKDYLKMRAPAPARKRPSKEVEGEEELYRAPKRGRGPGGGIKY